MFELKELVRLGFPGFYLPIEVKIRVTDSNLTSGVSDVNRYGIINRWVTHVGFPPKVWTVFDQNSPRHFGMLEGNIDGVGNTEAAAAENRNMVTWVDEIKNQHTYPKVTKENHMLWRTPTEPVKTKFGTHRCVLSRNMMQREIEIGFKIKQARVASKHTVVPSILFWCVHARGRQTNLSHRHRHHTDILN
jgi:hypothetical protein